MSSPFAMWFMMRGDADPDDGPPACPFCGHPVDELGHGVYSCGDCGTTWDDLDALQADAVEPGDAGENVAAMGG